MNAGLILFFALCFFIAAYLFYGRFLKRHFGVDPSRKTPAHDLGDGVDFVPAKNWWVLFGHHFSSICGAGPIVGPVLACAYWGWGVPLIWVFIGGVLMGAVSDFSALVMSVRAKGRSIAKVAGDEISPRVRFYFSIFLWIALILVIAVFAIVAAKTFIEEPDAVVPSVGLIPTALLVGWLFYRTKIPNWQAALAGLGILGALLYLGSSLQIQLPALGPFSSESVWILLLLLYCFVASVMPVQVLLQPRDFLAGFILFALIGMGVGAILWQRPEITAPAFTSWTPRDWPEAGALWPMLFVTVACGAISGFHALVSSGTTCKQLSSESHACRIGYGGMLTESLVAVLVILAVTAGLTYTELSGHLRSGGPIAAFGHAYGNISSFFLGDYGKVFAVLALNAFILTTLDTATRITRYITAELFGVKNIYLAALIVVAASGTLALSGTWNLLWPAFGASNQLIAGITLLIASCWLLRRRKHFLISFIPAALMLVTTLGAFAFQFWQAFSRRGAEGSWSPDWTMAVLAGILVWVALSILAEALSTFKNLKQETEVVRNG